MDSPNQSEETGRELLELIGHYDALVYAAVKQGRVAELPRESQILAKMIQEHLGLPHVHKALEFADVRGGEPYEVDGVSRAELCGNGELPVSLTSTISSSRKCSRPGSIRRKRIEDHLPSRIR
jgi:hypothetical protein